MQSTEAKENFSVKKAPSWLSKLLHFGTENGRNISNKPPRISHQNKGPLENLSQKKGVSSPKSQGYVLKYNANICFGIHRMLVRLTGKW